MIRFKCELAKAKVLNLIAPQKESYHTINYAFTNKRNEYLIHTVICFYLK